MTRPSPDVPTLTQLALIRLLYLHGVEQAAKPEPLSAFSLLAFHDAVELFLVLAADHLNAPLPKGDPKFMDYWFLLRPTDSFIDGVNLTAKGRMERLNRNRNSFKHAGAPPGRSAVEDALACTASFFEDNTEPVFGIAFDAIDMADVVPQEDIRRLLKSAAATEAGGDRNEAMADLAEAFGKLFHPYTASRYTAYGFGQTVQRMHASSIGMSAAMQNIAGALHRVAQKAGAPQNIKLGSAGRKIDDSVVQLNDVVMALQRGARVMALGIDVARYNRFEQLTPVVYYYGGVGERQVDSNYHGYSPNREEYDFCVRFVIEVALRVADVAANTVEPSWFEAQRQAAAANTSTPA